MISIYNLKPKFQKLLTPVMEALHALRITPNMITVYAILLSLFTGVAVWFNIGRYTLLLLPLCLLFRMILNALDGMLAKTYSLETRKGEMLNELGDVLSDVFLYLPLIKVTGQIYITVVFVLLSILNEFTGVLAKAITGKRAYQGPMGKSDRALLVSMYALLSMAGIPINHYAHYIFGLASLLLILSSYLRLQQTLLHHE